MSTTGSWRTGLAAGVVLAVLAVTFEAVRREEDYKRFEARETARFERLQQESDRASSAAEVARAATPPPPPTPATPSPDCPSGPDVFVPGSPASRRLRLVRRYVGTVGGEPATALLTWQNPDSIQGYFYLHRDGPEYLLVSQGKKALLVDAPDARDNAGPWQLRDQPGRLLVGTWLNAGWRQEVVLRESYAGAVRLAIETTHLVGGQGRPGHCDDRPSANQDFPRLLDPQTVPPPLRPVLAPSQAARHRAMLDDFIFDKVEYSLDVRLNDFHLLSYLLTYTDAAFEGGHPGHDATAHLFDLAGGQVLSLSSQLVPKYDLPLRRLLARHLLHDERFTGINRLHSRQWENEHDAATLRDTSMTNVLWLLRDLAPRPGWYLFTGAGLKADYWLNSLGSGMGSEHATVFIPYHELRPLVRPGTPLARMLRARGLW